MAQRSVRMPEGAGPRKVVVKDLTGRKISITEVPAATKHTIVNMVPHGSIEIYENAVLKHKAEVGKAPADVDFTPPPPPPPPFVMPERPEKPKRSVVARFLRS